MGTREMYSSLIFVCFIIKLDLSLIFAYYYTLN